MVAALCKELLFDLVSNKLSVEDRVSLNVAIEVLIKSGAVKKNELVLLDLYLSGYSAEEIAIVQFLSTETVINILSRLLIAIEYESGYLDELFVQKMSHKYSPRQITLLKKYLEKHGRTFTYETIPSTGT